jgi:dTDP-L-rhamnose 4-epimerase
VLVASSIGVYGEGAYSCRTHGPVAPTIRSEAQLAARDWEQRCPTCGEHVTSIPTPEDKALYRDNIYSMTKYHQEEMVLLIGKTYGIPSVAPRFFNVYGPRQSLSNPYAGVAAIWLSRLLNDRQLRDFVSIHDVVDCLVLMLETSGADFLPVNVGSGDTVTILEIANTLNRILGKSIDPSVTQAGRKFDIRHNTADITRAKSALGFSPKVSLDRGFSELVEWAKTTPDVANDFFDRALEELKQKGLLVKS